MDGIVTAPLNKAAMHAGGHNWPGHTELLAHEFGVRNFSLVLSAGDLYFFHLTAHVSLQQAIENCTPERADDVFNLAARVRRRARASRTRRSRSPGSTRTPGRTGIFGHQDADVLAPGRGAGPRARHQRARPDPGRRADPGRGQGQVEHRHRLLPRPGPRAVQGGLRQRRRQHHHRAARWSGCRSTTAPRSTSPARASPARTAWCCPASAPPSSPPVGGRRTGCLVQRHDRRLTRPSLVDRPTVRKELP